MKSFKRKTPQVAPHEVHERPVTRREFLAQGLVSSGAMLLMPSLALLAARKVAAADPTCALPALNNPLLQVPVICIDLAGGSNLAGTNLMVGGAKGQKDFLVGSAAATNPYRGVGLKAGGTSADAGTMGNSNFIPLGSHRPPQELGVNGLNEEFGIAFHPDSGILKGLQSQTSASTRACVDGMLFCTASADDTGNNPFNVAYWLARSGLKGRFGAAINTSSGSLAGKSTIPQGSFDPRYRPLLVSRPNSLSSVVGTGALGTMLSRSADRDRIFSFLNRMSGSALTRFTSMELGDQVKAMLGCSSQLSRDMMEMDTAALGIAGDADFEAVFPGVTGNSTGNAALMATICKALVDGYAGVATITLGGYDYHDGTLTTGKQQDFNAGALIGRALELFRRKGKPVMIYVFTDGGVYSSENLTNNNDPTWNGDDGEKGGAAIFALRPSVPRTSIELLREPFLNPDQYGRQVGQYHFLSNKIGVKRTAVVTGGDVTTLARAIVANHMALHNDDLSAVSARLVQITGQDNLSAAPGGLARYVGFRKIAG